MDIDSFLKNLFDCKLLASIDLSDSFDEYISARQNEVKDTKEYCKWEEERTRLEEGFLALYPDQDKGRKDIFRYNELTSKMQGDSEWNNFKYGFNEGVKLMLHLMDVALHGAPREVNLEGQSQK